MARIKGVSIPTEKRVIIALTYLYGIGNTTAKKILEKAQVDESIRVKDLTEDQINIIRTVVDEYTVEGELRREVLQNVKRLKDIGCYRGLRHIKRLPAHGQRTKTNSRTVRGNVRQTAGSGRRALTKT
ncbi:30S ribosomal protein S13 [Candidatus Uhrbacteria bacterium CG_4_9_14_0_2_um_filter_41_50]|uniref:Small ribosomal subunit protein uS13 n=1 Tax=Candidatus Uhrbacteria bacterium CG_4_9_14_0_2_um_filter_41_50 TaxID=1975031 RepID=A0A2M8EPX5_9BACT|nr:MAG: 30S ribosomal protein S13 [Candidatus Uhrbacteria bacterium CG_4_10_14_3_um_filter_41_21]PIZ54638.1 MAG: 30S ribosomal protein S13 [Candidatus Uhrbacteria bacterium CG_4_10_14_0_2_um_filter_41_21]PJB84657.1 MAG: 30S ribosomal protein S13 [Candidatus Uhrbacteria bacterium CG_4_9_14_0_8_um_filter_41_16]PJC24788.1 MAG: 30S ribosomal protein S13 [Candidatus Uhrbacteria bacterium CG_4_9_14_0_2_um_filter_41_50]PJE75131.1 MAG: 30S ribosomal protein S13 [Candidatus Uhrbacteria bacterium CG10_bi